MLVVRGGNGSVVRFSFSAASGNGFIVAGDGGEGVVVFGRHCVLWMVMAGSSALGVEIEGGGDWGVEVVGKSAI